MFKNTLFNNLKLAILNSACIYFTVGTSKSLDKPLLLMYLEACEIYLILHYFYSTRSTATM